MPSTGGIVFIRIRDEDTSSSARSTGSVTYLSLRTTSGQFTSKGVTSNLKNRRAMLPSRSEPVIDDSGMINNGWWNWFSFINGVFLAARSNPTLSDVIASIASIQGNNSTTEASIAALMQQTAANAQAVQAVIQVVQTAALPGATQVPPAQLAVQVTPSGSGPTGGGDSGAGGPGGGGD